MSDTQPPSLVSRLLAGWPGDVLAAGAFLTRLPLRAASGMEALAAASRAFPLIGLGLGAVAGGAMWLAAWANLHPLACAFMGVIAMAWMTGALHEDGLADFADGMGGRDKQRRLEIMRDSRIGSFGVLALIFAVGIKAAILAGLQGPGIAWAAFAAAAAMSRAVMAPCMTLLRPARADGLGKSAGRPDALVSAQSLAIGAVAAGILLGWQLGLAALAAALAAFLAVGWLARSRLGGYTGDVLGALQQVAEIFILLVVGAFLP